MGSLDPAAREFQPAYHQPPPLAPAMYPLLPPPPQAAVYYPYNPPAFYAPVEQVAPPPPLPAPLTPPTRALLLSSVPADASESTVRRELEIFGDVRAVQMERVREGIVAVHFYDLRAAHAALDQIRDQHLQHQHRLRLFYGRILARNCYSGAPPPPPPSPGLISGRPVWAQFMIPAVHAFPDGHNQGTLVVFNLNSQISASSLGEIFESYGPIRELRETPLKKHQKFVEFYDVRDAARAMAEMNGKEIGGKPILIEFSRPGGHSKRSHLQFSQSRSMKCHSPPPPHPLRRNPRRTSPTNVPPRAYSASQSLPSSKRCVKSVANRMAGLSLSGNGEEEIRDVKRSESKCDTAIVITKLKPNTRDVKSCRPWKGKNKAFDPRFLIKEDAIVDPDCRDTRTTVMIKNIPNKYSQKLLLNMLDNHCIHCNEQIASNGDESEPLSSYDFVYLPIDFNNKCNVGYGFVNMTSPAATLRLYKSFHQQHWEVFNSRKICEVTYARVQGLEALKEHFKNSKFACETEEYLPVVFSPPRDGRAHLSDPLPIVPCSHVGSPRHNGGSDATTTTTATTASVPSDDGNDGGGRYDAVLNAGSASSSSGGEDCHDDCDVGSNN